MMRGREHEASDHGAHGPCGHGPLWTESLALSGHVTPRLSGNLRCFSFNDGFVSIHVMWTLCVLCTCDNRVSVMADTSYHI